MFGIFNKSKAYDNISSAEFADRMKQSNTIVLDVRSREEFNSGHIKGAKNINVQSSDFHSRADQLDKSKEYLVYCRSGMRSASACNQMARQGFENVSNLNGGIMAWRGKIER